MASNVNNKLLLEKSGGTTSASYVGNVGEVFFDPTQAVLRASNGITPGGIKVSVGVDESLVTAAKTNYETILQSWYSALAQEQYRAGHPWFKWNVNGETASAYLAELTAGWTAQNVPSSPPTNPADLPFQPAISAAYYNQLRTILISVNSAYGAYVAALENKQIDGDSLTVPEILQTTPEEDLVVRLRTAAPSSPPSSNNYTNLDFTFGVNSTLRFPNNTVQTGAAISRAELKNIVANSADFAAFKAAIAAL